MFQALDHILLFRTAVNCSNYVFKYCRQRNGAQLSLLLGRYRKIRRPAAILTYPGRRRALHRWDPPYESGFGGNALSRDGGLRSGSADRTGHAGAFDKTRTSEIYAGWRDHATGSDYCAFTRAFRDRFSSRFLYSWRFQMIIRAFRRILKVEIERPAQKKSPGVRAELRALPIVFCGACAIMPKLIMTDESPKKSRRTLWTAWKLTFWSRRNWPQTSFDDHRKIRRRSGRFGNNLGFDSRGKRFDWRNYRTLSDSIRIS